MFFILSKTLVHLFMPLTLITASFLVSLFIKSRFWKRRLRIFGLVLLLVCTNPFLTNAIFKWWEVPATPMEEVPADHKVGIVLTGITKKDKDPRDRIYLREGADRVTHAIQLYRMGTIEKIIISGGTGELTGPKTPEAGQLLELFQLCGIPSEDLLMEDRSRNTRESALAVAAMVEREFHGSQFLLITSAFHMRRAVACYAKAGIAVTGFSTDFKTSDGPPEVGAFFIPKPSAIQKWHLLIRELLGFAAYKMAGYL